MPNNICNIVSFEGSLEKINELIDFVKGEETAFDFEKIIPMPKELNLTSGGDEKHSISAFLSAINPANTAFPYAEKMCDKNFVELLRQMNNTLLFGKYEATLTPVDVQEKYLKCSNLTVEDYVELGSKYVSNFTKYGSTTWYDFCYSSWGTKWNAYDVTLNNNTFAFMTAWACPFPIFEKLSSLFPSVAILVEFADEGVSENCGFVFFEDGCKNDVSSENLNNLIWGKYFSVKP